MKLRCPVCHSSNSLEAFTAADAGRELLVLLASTGPLFRPLVAYLGLFRPANRDLSHERALRLAREVVELGADPRALAAALTDTVEAMRAKRDAGQIKPLTNHNYLRKVLETVQIPPSPPLAKGGGERSERGDLPRSKRAQGIAALEDWSRG
jgi:hypothetical protein